MKAATSSIALATFVAFGGLLVLPRFSFGNQYMHLNNYLTRVQSYDLETNIRAVETYINQRRVQFERLDADYKSFFNTFVRLEYHDDPSRLCKLDSLLDLWTLVEAGLNYHESLTDPHKKARVLNELLRRQKHKVNEKCFSFFQLKWDEHKEREGSDGLSSPSNRLEGSPLVAYLNSNPPENDVLERLLYSPKDTPQSITSNDNRILEIKILKALLADGSDLRSMTPNRFKRRVETHFFGKLQGLAMTTVVDTIIRPAYLVLKLTRMDFLEEHNPSGMILEKGNFVIEYMPAYIIFEEVVMNRVDEHKQLISNLYERLMNDES